MDGQYVLCEAEITFLIQLRLILVFQEMRWATKIKECNIAECHLKKGAKIMSETLCPKYKSEEITSRVIQ